MQFLRWLTVFNLCKSAIATTMIVDFCKVTDAPIRPLNFCLAPYTKFHLSEISMLLFWLVFHLSKTRKV